MTTASFPKITPEGLKAFRDRIGIVRPLKYGFNTEVTIDNIRRYCLGTGDENPLYLDEGYARKTRWGGIIAPPCSIYGFGLIQPEGLRGIHAQYAGDEFEFLLPMRLGDKITGQTKLIEVIEKKSAFAGRTLLERTEGLYHNQKGEVVTRQTISFIRHERDTARETNKYKEIKPKTWTMEELDEIDRQYARQVKERRGATPRYWEDVRVGEDLPVKVKGPLTINDVIWSFMAIGGMPWSYAYDSAYRLRMKLPEVFVRNTQGAWDSITRDHWEWEFATAIGAPGPYDLTFNRMSCLAHMVTDWMGDDGWLKSIQMQTRKFNILGDVYWLHGKVTGKEIKGQEHCVSIELWGRNQRDEATTVGSAVVILPSKARSPGRGK